MVNRTKTNTARTNNASTDNASGIRLSKKSAAKNKYVNDDLIGSLSDAYENKRAQQVSEWQSLQPMVMRRAA